jgi:hypothetical protein
MKTTIALLALMSLELAIPMQVMATPPAKPTAAQQAAATAAANVKSNAQQATPKSNGNAQQAQGNLQCRDHKGKPAHCN